MVGGNTGDAWLDNVDVFAVGALCMNCFAFDVRFTRKCQNHAFVSAKGVIEYGLIPWLKIRDSPLTVLTFLLFAY